MYSDVIIKNYGGGIIFGDDIKKTIEEYYDSDKLEELIELSEHMLSGYMGEENASKLLRHLKVMPLILNKV